jgi:PAS domain S-box-containing protein
MIAVVVAVRSEPAAWAHAWVWPLLSLVLVLAAGFMLLRLSWQRHLTRLLRIREERLEISQSLAHAGTWDWDVALDIIEVSAELRRILALEGEGTFKAWETFKSRIHPGDHTRVVAALKAAFETPRLEEMETRVVRPSGEVRWVRVQANVYHDGAGRPVRLVGVMLDVTERREADRRLQASETQFRGIFDHMQDGYFGADLDGSIRLVSPAGVAMLGYASASELVGKDMARDVYVDPGRRARLMVQLLGEPESNVCYAAAFKRRDGGEIAVEGNVLLSRRADGTPRGVEGIFRDVTARHREEQELAGAQEEALQASRAKSQFLANVSHEIRTPMNAIIGLAHLALGHAEDPRQRAYLTKIHAAGQILLGIMNDVLDSSKIEAGKLTLEERAFELAPVLGGVRDMSAARAEERGLKVSFSVADDVPAWLVGDSLRLGQVLMNLVGNAVKFTSQGEVAIAVGVARRGSADVELSFRVRDSGIGMTDAQVQALFQPFSQADGSTTRRYGGTGLGLSISKQLVELMKGTLEAESVFGEGSTFTFSAMFGVGKAVEGASAAIAAADVAGEARGAHVHGDPDGDAAGRLRGLRILVIEDNEINQQIACELLRAAGADVVTARNGWDGVAAVEAATAAFDVILMDVQMPVMDGYEATRALRSGPRWERLPIIAMTAHAEDDERRRCLAVGMNDHLSKPIKPEELVDMVERWARPAGPPASALPAPPASEAPAPVVDAAPYPGSTREMAQSGIDLPSALRRLGGNRVLLDRLVDIFRNDAEHVIERLRRGLRAGELAQVRLTVHSLEGASANLSAMAIAAAAHAVNQHLRSGDLDATERALEPLAQALEPLLRAPNSRSVFRASPDSAPGAAAPTARARAGDERDADRLFVEMRALLHRRSLTARGCFDRLSEQLAGHRLDHQLAEIRRGLEQLDFEVCVALLAHLEREWATATEKGA